MDAKERKFLELMDGFIIQARKDYPGEIVMVKGKLRLLIHRPECGKLKKDYFFSGEMNFGQFFSQNLKWNIKKLKFLYKIC